MNQARPPCRSGFGGTSATGLGPEGDPGRDDSGGSCWGCDWIFPMDSRPGPGPGSKLMELFDVDSNKLGAQVTSSNEEQGAQNGAASSKTGSAMPFHGNTCSVHWGGMRQDQQGSEERHRARGRLQLRC